MSMVIEPDKVYVLHHDLGRMAPDSWIVYCGGRWGVSWSPIHAAIAAGADVVDAWMEFGVWVIGGDGAHEFMRMCGGDPRLARMGYGTGIYPVGDDDDAMIYCCGVPKWSVTSVA